MSTISLDALPSIYQVIREHGLSATKALGQNFLTDLPLTCKIARQFADLDAGSTILEVGPGPGALTRALLHETPSRIVALEKDERCLPVLNTLYDLAPERFSFHACDALTYDLAELATDQPINIAANLPYNIATELLKRWCDQCYLIDQMVLMFQKEVAERLVALPHTKAYGRLSILIQSLFAVEKSFDIAPQAFTPAPKVTSSVLHFRRLPKVLKPEIYRVLKIVTHVVFQQRRKMIKNPLTSLLGSERRVEELLGCVNASPSERPEQLTVRQFQKLALYVHESKILTP